MKPCYPAPGIRLAEVVRAGLPALKAKHGMHLNQDQRQALWAIEHCRTPALGEMLVDCTGCTHHQRQPLSCGHRSCPKCQNHTASQWLDRQRAKLLPVEYFMATFTLPSQLRALAWQHPKVVYAALFAAASGTLRTFGFNGSKNGSLKGSIGLCAVLHTHSRALDYHPHLHVVIPGGALDTVRRQWRVLQGKYLFRGDQLATVFRARMLAELSTTDLTLPMGLPNAWVVDCRNVGRGLPAIKYLSRYLYRGVLSERNITALDHSKRSVTFRYKDSGTGQVILRTLAIEDFLWRLMQHVLPKGFRRVRDYGFLHGNAKRWLHLLQLILHVDLPGLVPRPRPVFHCPLCRAAMQITGFIPSRWRAT
jgi:hypothetical protein